MDQSGNLFCSLISLGALVKWVESGSGSNYTADNLQVVAYNPHKIRFVTLALKELHTLHQWTNLSLGDDLLKGNRFLPVDVDIEYGDEGRHRTFLTIPRLGIATPFTLATVVAKDNAVVENPRLEAYPSKEWHVPPNNCSGITSAIRTFVSATTLMN